MACKGMWLGVVLVAACSGCSGCPPGQPNTVVIYYREPFNFGNYYDPSGRTVTLILGPGITIPYISILCIENHSPADFNFDPNNLIVNLGYVNGGSNAPNNVGLLTASSPPFEWGVGAPWPPPPTLGLRAALVPRQSNFVAPRAFNAISAGADSDPADQPGASIPGDPNHVARHTVTYRTVVNQTVTLVGMQDFNPRWQLQVGPLDFAAAQIVSEPPPQNLPPPSCP